MVEIFFRHSSPILSIAHCFLGKCLDIHEVWKEVLTILNAVVRALTIL